MTNADINTDAAGLTEPEPDIETSSSRSPLWLAGAAIIGGLAVSACCVLPLLLVIIGVGGSWIGTLVAFEPYKVVTIPMTIAMLGAGFYFAYRKPKLASCNADGTCGTPTSIRIARTMLWIGSVIAVVGIVFPYLAPSFL